MQSAEIPDVVGWGWGEHDREPRAVLERVTSCVERANEPGEVLQLAALGTHVAGEHLGDWKAGRALVEGLRSRVEAEGDADKALWRMAAMMELAAGNEWEPLLARGLAGNPDSCRIRVLGLAAQALAARGETARAGTLLEECERLAAYGPEKGDPAANVLAMTGNNVACTLEEKADRTPDEDAMLLRAAQMGRRFWEIAGDWRNVKIAEYRLAMSNLALGRLDAAEAHAQTALDLCVANDGGPGDAFFCHEALARAAHARGDAEAAKTARDAAATCLERIEDESTRTWCAGELQTLDGVLGTG